MFWHRFSYSRLAGIRHQAPALTIEVCSTLRSDLKTSVEAIIDTGADRTCIPERVFIDLGLDFFAYRLVQAQGAVGPGAPRALYIANIKIAKCTTRNIEVLGLDVNFALIGRDILNLHRVHLEGPQLLWSVDKKCPQLP